MRANSFKIYPSIIYTVLFTFFVVTCSAQDGGRWSEAKASAWYAGQVWPVGANYTSSNAINQLEMWQAESFNPGLIDKELGYAEGIGMNVMRVFLHHLAWQVDSTGFKSRINQYLDISSKHGIKTMFVFFDDVWNDTYKQGKQPDPKVGTHNSGWIQDPGKLLAMDLSSIHMLGTYVRDILSTFKHDKRVLLWDLYNEPGNSGHRNETMPLLDSIFQWGRQVNPDQPLSAGVWALDLMELNDFQLSHSDVITYHNYGNEAEHQKWLDSFLLKLNRPLICTEYMARTRNSRFQNIMPILKAHKIGAINWGLISGKTNTIYAWDTPVPDGSEPKIWFHDIFRKDGSPYSQEEIDFLKKMTGK